MKKWGRQIALTALSAGLFVFTSAGGYGGDYPCEPCNCWDPCLLGEFEIGGEFLWWKPGLDHLEYAIVDDCADSFDEKFTYKILCPDWEPGGRVWIYKPFLFCNHGGFGVSWMGICSKDSVSLLREGIVTKLITSPLLVFPNFNFNELNISWKAAYHAYDILFSYPCYCGNCHVFRPFFGFAGLVLDQGMHLEGEFFLNRFKRAIINWKSNLCAYGLCVGTKYECQLVGCLNLFGKISATVLRGKPQTKNVQFFEHFADSSNQTITISGDKCSRVYPGYHLEAGIVYDACLCNANFSFRVGYEYVEWHNLPYPHRFFEEVETMSVANGSASSDQTLGWQGLFTGVSVGF